MEIDLGQLELFPQAKEIGYQLIELLLLPNTLNIWKVLFILMQIKNTFIMLFLNLYKIYLATIIQIQVTVINQQL